MVEDVDEGSVLNVAMRHKMGRIVLIGHNSGFHWLIASHRLQSIICQHEKIRGRIYQTIVTVLNLLGVPAKKAETAITNSPTDISKFGKPSTIVIDNNSTAIVEIITSLMVFVQKERLK